MTDAFDYWHIKILYDLTGYITAFIATWFFYRKIIRPDELPNPFTNKNQKGEYYLSVIAGAMLGGIVISTFDGAMIPGRNPVDGIILSKSIAGALFGGVITAELFKYLNGIKTPTGILFLPGIVLGVFIGRFGAIATGVRDFTYGLPTTLPWGMDLGDGILRHPTMIYEMVLLAVFFAIFCFGLYSSKRAWWIHNGFYVFIIVYFLYRFSVGFIQPYSTFWFGLSTYQVIAIPMVTYGVWMMRKKNF
ncbi:MAG: prolipoprotein diacylglyceryl transferase [Candidatus Gracilibacteria bacterium]|nr:prolipoprotein diacylglyceryl transferase [Candidatus Gracilibacteria bacterium]